MENREIASRHASLIILLETAERAAIDNIELGSHLGRYACIMAAGFLEVALKELYGRFIETFATPQVAKFAMQRLDRISNPKTGVFIEVAGGFDEKWGKELSIFLDEPGKPRRAAIDSIMINRNWIAHGENSDITTRAVSDYLRYCVEVIEFIEKQLSDSTIRQPEVL